MKLDDLKLEPCVQWVRLSSGGLQVTGSLGESITFTDHTEEIERFLTALRDNTSAQEDGVGLYMESSQFRQALIEALRSANVISAEDEPHCYGLGISLLRSHAASMRKRKSWLRTPLVDEVTVVGDGVIATQVDSLVSGLTRVEPKVVGSAEITEEESSVLESYKTLQVVCCDYADFAYMRKHNSEIEAAKDNLALFVSWGSGQLTVGPFVVPGESACYECYLLRRFSNSNYTEEFLARTSGGLEVGGPAWVDDELFRSIVSFSVGRAILAIRLASLDLFEPGQVETWDPLRAEKTSGVVLRSSLCEVCSTSKTAHKRAIRAIN